MPFISIPKKGMQGYFDYCDKHNAETDEKARYMLYREAHAYSKAITDICGSSVWGHIQIESELRLPDGFDCCAGLSDDVIPLIQKGIPHDK